MISALLLLVLNLLHPTSQVTAGLAQCIFQFSIAAPLFWMYRAVRSPAMVERLLVLIFAMNALSAGLGMLQVYYPGAVPALRVQLAWSSAESGRSRRADVCRQRRPPDRSASRADRLPARRPPVRMTAILGLGCCLRRRQPAQALGILGAGDVGLRGVYLRRCVHPADHRRPALVASSLSGGGASPGGRLWRSARIDRVVRLGRLGRRRRRSATASSAPGLRGHRCLSSNRGAFVTQTIGELLDQYPLGAGVGRWGMMNTYFGQPGRVQGRANLRGDPAHRLAARWRRADVAPLRRRGPAVDVGGVRADERAEPQSSPKSRSSRSA